MKAWPAATEHNHPIAMNVQLLYQPLGVVNAVTRWVSEEAMGVDTGRVVLQHFSEVEITFPHQQENRTIYHRICAHVSQHHQGTATLHLLHCSLDAHRALHALMTATTHR